MLSDARHSRYQILNTVVSSDPSYRYKTRIVSSILFSPYPHTHQSHREPGVRVNETRELLFGSKNSVKCLVVSW